MVLQNPAATVMAVEMVLRNPAATVMEAATTELTPWHPVPAVTASPRSTVAVMTVITASLQSTVVPVATIGPTPENTVVTTEMDHRSTVITVTRDPWSAGVTAETDHRSTTMAVAPDPWNTGHKRQLPSLLQGGGRLSSFSQRWGLVTKTPTRTPQGDLHTASQGQRQVQGTAARSQPAPQECGREGHTRADSFPLSLLPYNEEIGRLATYPQPQETLKFIKPPPFKMESLAAAFQNYNTTGGAPV